MPNNGPPLRRRSVVALVAALVLLFAVIIGSTILAFRQDEVQGWVQHTLAVENLLDRIQIAIRTAESDERGYLLTGNDAFRASYTASRDDLLALEKNLVAATSDNPDQTKAAADLSKLVMDRLTPLDQAVELYASGRTEDATAIVRSNQGAPRMAAVEAAIAAMTRREQGLFQSRDASLRMVSTALEAGIGISLLISALLAYFVVRQMRERIASLIEAYGSLAEANARLEREIIERERLEHRLRQAQKMEALGQLTGGIAHDFNNMLAVIMSCLGLIRRRIAKDDYRIEKYIDGATEAGDKAAALTHRLLAFGRQQPLSPQPIDANKLVSGTSDMLRRTLGELELETVLAGGLWRTHVDPNQLENALINLAVNARDAMPDGGKLTIETGNASLDESYAAQHEEVTAGQYVLISVTDTGTGMSEDVLARAFDPFFTTKAVGKGTGLGLSQVFGFVKQSGGHVKIYSEVGVGTSVKVYLPRAAADGRDLPEERNESGKATDQGNEDITIMVVEDEPRMREIAGESLSELGYKVIVADSAAAALELLRQNPQVALLFTDIIMPEMNGRELARKAQSIQPNIKVLYTTGFSRNAIIHNGVLDVGLHFIPKPFNLAQLARKVSETLAN